MDDCRAAARGVFSSYQHDIFLHEMTSAPRRKSSILCALPLSLEREYRQVSSQTHHALDRIISINHSFDVAPVPLFCLTAQGVNFENFFKIQIKSLKCDYPAK